MNVSGNLSNLCELCNLCKLCNHLKGVWTTYPIRGSVWYPCPICGGVVVTKPDLSSTDRYVLRNFLGLSVEVCREIERSNTD